MRYNNYLFVLIFTCWVNLLFAQEVYTGEYTLKNGYSGHSTHEYKLVQQQKVLHGPFRFQADSSYLENDSNYFQSLTYKGGFKDGLAHGSWDFSRSTIKKSGEAFYDGENISYRVAGKRKTWFLPFLNGEVNGEGSMHEFALSNGKIIDTLFFAEATIRSGKFLGEFNSRSKQAALVFNVSATGLFDRNYTYTTKDQRFTDQRSFEEGLLTQHIISIQRDHIPLNYPQFLHRDTALNFTYFTCDDEEYKILSYFARKELKNKHSQLYSKDWLKDEKSHLSQSLNALVQLNGDSVWDQLEGMQSFDSPKLRLHRKELSAEDASNLDNLTRKFYSLKKGLEYYLKDEQKEFNQHINREVALHYAIFGELKDFIEHYDEIVEFLGSNRINYIDYTFAIAALFDPYEFRSDVQFEFGDERVSHKMQSFRTFNLTTFNLSSFIDYLTEIVDYFNELDGQTKPLVEENKQNLSIADQETDLVKLKDSINALYGSDSQTRNDYHNRFGPGILAFVNSDFRRYVTLPVDERKNEITNRLNCYRAYIRSYHELAKLADRVAGIEELYTRTTWNPFTFTDMDEIVKERVYNAYKGILLEYLLENLFKNYNCGSVSNKLDNFAILYRKMIELREQDTQDLERSLRRISDPTKVMEIFNLDLYVD